MWPLMSEDSPRCFYEAITSKEETLEAFDCLTCIISLEYCAENLSSGGPCPFPERSSSNHRISKTWSILRWVVLGPLLISGRERRSKWQGGITWVCKNSTFKQTLSYQPLVGLRRADTTKKKQPSGNEERSGEDYLVGGCFLMSREDPRTDSEGCRGGLCSGSGRRRWRGRRCTWAWDDCPSGSERQIERACVWVTAAFGNDYLLTLRIFNM